MFLAKLVLWAQAFPLNDSNSRLTLVRNSKKRVTMPKTGNQNP